MNQLFSVPILFQLCSLFPIFGRSKKEAETPLEGTVVATGTTFPSAEVFDASGVTPA